MLDFRDYPVTDSHCHPFLPENETDSFEQYLTIAFHPVPKEDMENTFIYRQVVRELSRILDVDGSHRRVVEERQRRYKEDPVGYIKLLFDDAKIDTLLVDTGYPSDVFTGYSIDLKEFSKVVPSKLKEVLRIDNVVFKLFSEGLSFEEACDFFHRQTHDAVRNGVVGLKTVVAYSTGLEIRRDPIEDVRDAYQDVAERVRAKVPIRDIFYSTGDRIAKKVLDYFVFQSLEDSVELKVPLQIHSAMGAMPVLDLRIVNPILLYDFINDPSAKEAKIILVHGGYPYVEEAGFLVNTYPQVFLDFSETIPHISVGVKEKLLNYFEMAPTNKIMYGSDGYTSPEQYWISAIQTKKALADALNGLVNSNEIGEDWAREIGKQILYENANKLFKI